MKKLFTAILCLCIILSLPAKTVSAAESNSSGQTISKTLTLTCSASGQIS